MTAADDHALLRTPRITNDFGEPAAWCVCGQEFVGAKLGDAHAAVFEHVVSALVVGFPGPVENPVWWSYPGADPVADVRTFLERLKREPGLLDRPGGYGAGAT